MRKNKYLDLNKEKDEESIIEFNIWLSLFFLFFATVSIFVLALPLIHRDYNYPDLGDLGDTFGGFVGPIVAIIASILTFLAFYIQYLANKQIQKQFYIQQFESQFYEMIRLHKENINEMKISGYDIITEKMIEYENEVITGKTTVTTTQVAKYTEGRKVFVTMITELVCCFELIEYFNDLWGLKNMQDDLLKLAYEIFFFGTKSNAIKSKNIPIGEIELFKYELNKIRINHKSSNGERNIYTGLNGTEIKLYVKYSPFSGHESRLGHYYRHLYSTVKFVVQKDKELLSYSEVRQYLKLIRSQMSNDEVLMLYYNYIIGFGSDWEENKFLTLYRLIHNLPLDAVQYVKDPREHFEEFIESIKDSNDPLFEWGDYSRENI